MAPNMLRRTTLASLLAAGALTSGYGVATTQAQNISPCPTGVTISVTPPAAGSATVTVATSPAVTIKPASEGDPASFHLHYFVDTPAVAAGEPVPTGNPKIIHSGKTTQDLGSLAAGEHTVTVVLGQVNHMACEARGSVTFTSATAVTAAPAAPVPAATGSGGLLGGDDGGAAALPAAVGATALLAMLGIRQMRRTS